jgi:hypothetical protein
MSDTDGRFARRDPGTPAGGVGRFGDDRPRWPSLRGDADAGAGTPAGTPADPADPAVSASGDAQAPTRRSRRFAAADDAVPSQPVDPAERSAALARADAALRAGETQARTAALARADAALHAAGAAGPADPAPGGADEGGADRSDEPAASRGRRRWVVVGAVVAAVLVLGGAGTAWFLTRDDGGTAAAPPDVVLPSPTASVAPAARTATTAFASALPTTLLQYALASSADDEDWLAQNALEAYAETYTDGGAGTVTVQAGQWETPEEAAAVVAAVTATLPTAEASDAADAGDAADAATGAATDGASADAGDGPAVLLQGEVLVDGSPVGTVTVVDAGDGTGVAAWSNGTTAFVVRGPAADIRNLYAAYPL